MGRGEFGLARLQLSIEPRIDTPGIAFEDLLPVRVGQVRACVDISLRVIEELARLRIAAAHSANHLRAEKDVVDRDDAGQEFNAGLVIYTGIEGDVL